MTRQENKKYVREHFQDAQVYVKNMYYYIHSDNFLGFTIGSGGNPDEAWDMAREAVEERLESSERATDGDSDIKVSVPLHKLVHNDEACNKLGLNPYCINEGADRNAMYSISVEDAKSWRII